MNRSIRTAVLLLATGIAPAIALADSPRRLSQIGFDRPVSKEMQKEASNIRKASEEKEGYTYRFMTERRTARPMLAREKRAAQKDISVHTADAAVITAQAEPVKEKSGVVAVEVSAERAPTLIYNQTQYLNHLPEVLSTDTPKEAIQPWEILRSKVVTGKTGGSIERSETEKEESPNPRTPIR